MDKAQQPTEPQKDFWAELDRRIRREQKMIHWMINGQFVHGISPKYHTVTPEWVEQHYNVDFGD